MEGRAQEDWAGKDQPDSASGDQQSRGVAPAEVVAVLQVKSSGRRPSRGAARLVSARLDIEQIGIL